MTFTIEQLEHLRDKLERNPPRNIIELQEAANPKILLELIAEKRRHQHLRKRLEKFVEESTHRIFEDADEYGDGWNLAASRIALILKQHT